MQAILFTLFEELVMHRVSAFLTTFDTSLIDSLMSPDAFGHPVTHVELIETHISWLILTERYAYKIKKPIVLEFLDFGDLEKRRYYCEEEIRLNQPWAPGIYLDVVPITIDRGKPCFGGTGEPIEYAVRMNRFDENMRLDKQLEQDNLSVQDMRELASKIATRHKNAPLVEPEQRERVVSLTKEFMWDNFKALDGFIDSATLDSLRAWTEEEIANVDSLLSERFDDGFVRDCHGDLHLANIVRLPDGITTFDCIEFNTDFRNIDVMSDIAFLIMDLVERNRHDLAAHFLNRYLEATGDYGGVAVLSLFFVYRCLVRAKVAVIRSQEREGADDRDDDINEARAYCDMAMRQAVDRTPMLIIMHGLSGSGKTFVSGLLMAALPAIRVRSDTERKRIVGLSERSLSHSDVGEGIYTEDVNHVVYERLYEIARVILRTNHRVILDAAFLEEAQRVEAMKVASDCDCKAIIVDVAASPDVLRERLRQRSRNHNDPSEAGISVLEHQISMQEPLTPVERNLSVACENQGLINITELVELIVQPTSLPSPRIS